MMAATQQGCQDFELLANIAETGDGKKEYIGSLCWGWEIKKTASDAQGTYTPDLLTMGMSYAMCLLMILFWLQWLGMKCLNRKVSLLRYLDFLSANLADFKSAVTK